MLAKEPGEKVIYDVRASWAVPETIERSGGIPLVNRVGHAFIKQRMRTEDAVFAGEVSAHYYFRDFSQADTGVVPFLVMLELLSRAAAAALGVLAPVRDASSSPARSTRRSRTSRSSSRSSRSASAGAGAFTPRRDLDRLRRLALQRPAVEHRASPPAEPRSAARRSPMVEKRDEVLGVIRA